MATLAQATQSARTALKWIGIGIVVFMIIRLILLPITVLVYGRIFPQKPPPPAAKFGQLPQIPFPVKESPKNLQFSIKTTTGTLPQMATGAGARAENRLPDRVAIYKTREAKSSFSSLDRVKEKVNVIGFPNEGVALSPTVYQWLDPQVEERKIIFNIVTDEFHLTTMLATASADLAGPPPDKTAATAVAKDLLASVKFLPSDIDSEKTATAFLKIKNGKLIKTTSLSDSEYIQVNLYRKPVDNLPIVNPDPEHGLISFLIKAGGDLQKQVVSADYTYKYLDSSSASNYPIKSAKEAFEDLKNGQGYIAGGRANQIVNIRKVYLAYYEGNDDLTYFLPVFVFEGDDDFQALVPAIRADLVE